MSVKWLVSRRALVQVGVKPADHVAVMKWGGRYGIELVRFDMRWKSDEECWRLHEFELMAPGRHDKPFRRHQVEQPWPGWLVALEAEALLRAAG